MDIHKTRTCERCKAVIPLDQVRLLPKDKDKSMLVCENCVKEVAKKTTSLQSKTKPLLIPEYQTYFCNRCKYSFRVDINKIGVTYNLHCPYCSKSDRLEKK